MNQAKAFFSDRYLCRVEGRVTDRSRVLANCSAFSSLGLSLTGIDTNREDQEVLVHDHIHNLNNFHRTGSQGFARCPLQATQDYTSEARVYRR